MNTKLADLPSLDQQQQASSGWLWQKIDWLLLVCPMVIWALARPSQGVRHDAILYVAQVLSRQMPEVFGQDIFFAYGSQDNFSVYSRLMALGLQAGWMTFLPSLLLWLSHAGLLLGIYALLRPLPGGRWLAACGMVSVAALPHVYGGRHLIAFGEEFLTARTLAEPLVLLALVLRVRDASLGWIAAALLGAMAFHPLIALPGWLVVWVSLCLQSRRWWWWLLLVPVMLALGAAGLAPFDRLLLRYDDAWWAVVQTFNEMVFVSRWHLSDALTVLFSLSVVAWGGWRQQGSIAPMLKSAVLVALVTLLISFLLGDLGRNVLVLGLQSWRSLWLAHLLALATLPGLLWSNWQQGHRGQVLALSLLLVATGLGWELGWAFFLWLGLAGWLFHAQPVINPVLWRALKAATVTALLVVGARTGWLSWSQAQQGGRYAHLQPFEFVMQIPVLALAVGGVLIWLLACARRNWRLAGVGLLLVALVAGVRGWDQRHAWQRYLDGAVYQSHPFQRFIPLQSQVYWDHEVQGAWFLLRRASYFSVNQGGGVLFNRQTALEFSHRADQFALLEAQRTTCQMLTELNGRDAQALDDCYPTDEVVEELCEGEPGLNYMVFGRNLGRGVLADWVPPVTAGTPSAHYWLHDCAAFRKSN
jgi:hypothetical protein